MPPASACGKAILLGEHAVVYGQPAIAIPLPNLRAVAEARPLPAGTGIVVSLSDLGREVTYCGNEPVTPDSVVEGVRLTIRNTLQAVQAHTIQPVHVTLQSQLPPARGLGSGTAVTIALVRALSDYYGKSLAEAEVSAIAFETEVLYHGHPSGVDNTVIAYEQPVCFKRGEAPQLIGPIPPFDLVIADSGIASHTRAAVEMVRQRWLSQPERYNRIFQQIGLLIEDARTALLQGNWPALGELMNANQSLLQEIGVSSPELAHLVDAALAGGALGAKLTGGGLGGCVIALSESEYLEQVQSALAAAGARQVWVIRGQHAHRD